MLKARDLTLFVRAVRQHNHYAEGRNQKHGSSTNQDSKARKLASEAADEEVLALFAHVMNFNDSCIY